MNASLARRHRLSSARLAIDLNLQAKRGVYLVMSRDFPHLQGYSPVQAGLLAPQALTSYLLAASRDAWPVRRFGVKVAASGGLLLLSGALIGYHLLT